jgi:hypothetical protein
VVIDRATLSHLCINKGPYPSRKEVSVICLSTTSQETRRRDLLELERRFGDNHTGGLNGSDVVKCPHDLVCMGLDLRMCTCTHLVKKEAALVKDAVVEAYVVYGMNVFEYEQDSHQRIRENQTDKPTAALDHAECDSLKKSHREEERRTMQFGVLSGVSAEDDCGFTDEETAEVSLEQDV